MLLALKSVFEQSLQSRLHQSTVFDLVESESPSGSYFSTSCRYTSTRRSRTQFIVGNIQVVQIQAILFGLLAGAWCSAVATMNRAVVGVISSSSSGALAAALSSPPPSSSPPPPPSDHLLEQIQLLSTEYHTSSIQELLILMACAVMCLSAASFWGSCISSWLLIACRSRGGKSGSNIVDPFLIVSPMACKVMVEEEMYLHCNILSTHTHTLLSAALSPASESWKLHSHTLPRLFCRLLPEVYR